LTSGTALILWFIAGFALEALYLVRRDPKWGQLAAVAGFALFGGVLTYTMSHVRDPSLFIGVWLAVFGFMLGIVYTDEILPAVSDKLLLAFTLIYWYSLVTEYYHGTSGQRLLMYASVPPSVASLYVAVMRPPLGFWSKLALYTWYLVIVVVLGLLQFPFGNLKIFGGRSPGWLGPIDALATGLVLMYLLANVSYLYLLIPMPSRGQSFGDRMQEWHQFTQVMTQRCSDEDGPPAGQGFAILGVLGAGLLLNYRFALLPNPLVISLAMIAAALLLERPPVRQVLAG
jgi:hypothetical protein